MVDTERRSWRCKSDPPAVPLAALVRIPSPVDAAGDGATEDGTRGQQPGRTVAELELSSRRRADARRNEGGEEIPKCSLMDLLFLFPPSASI